MVLSAVEKEICDRGYTTARKSGSDLIRREGIGRDPGSLTFEGDHRSCGGVQGGVAFHDSPVHHREIEQQESSGKSVRLGRLGRTAQCNWTLMFIVALM